MKPGGGGGGGLNPSNGVDSVSIPSPRGPSPTRAIVGVGGGKLGIRGDS